MEPASRADPCRGAASWRRAPLQLALLLLTAPRSADGISCFVSNCPGTTGLSCDPATYEHTLLDCASLDAYSTGPGLTRVGNPYDSCGKLRTRTRFTDGTSYRCTSMLDGLEQDEYHCNQCNDAADLDTCSYEWWGDGYVVEGSGLTKNYWCCNDDHAPTCNVPGREKPLSALEQAAADAGGGSNAIGAANWAIQIQIECTDGTYAVFGTYDCLTCEPGFADTDLSPVSPCVNCGAGHFTAAGATLCTTCAAGQYDNDAGAGNISSATPCVSCAAGKASAGGGTECSACAAGQYAAAGSSACAGCPAGSYDHDADATTPCAFGFQFYQETGWQVCFSTHGWPICQAAIPMAAYPAALSANAALPFGLCFVSFELPSGHLEG